MLEEIQAIRHADLFLRNRPHCFQNTCIFETGISDLHEMVVTVTEVFYKAQKQELFNMKLTENLIENFQS